MITVKCIECKKSFEAQRTSAKFCSANCRVKFNSKKDGKIDKSKKKLDSEKTPITKDEPPKFQTPVPWIQDIRLYCDRNKLNPTDLPNYIDNLRSQLSASHEEIKGLKALLSKKEVVKQQKEGSELFKTGNSSVPASKYLSERLNLKNGVKTKTEKKETAE